MPFRNAVLTVAPWEYLLIRRLQQFGDLTPVDIVRIESQRHPSPVAVMRRWDKPAILAQRLGLERVRQEVKGSS